MKLNKFNKIVNETSRESMEEIKFQLDVLERIEELLDEKFDGKQKLLAEKLGKTEAEVSKWLNNAQNFTIKTLIKLQIAFGDDIIAVCTNSEKATFKQVKLPLSNKQTVCVVNENGGLNDETRTYTHVSNTITNLRTENISI